MIKSNPCKLCASTWHTKAFCPQNRKPLKVSNPQPLKRYKRPALRGKRSIEYQAWRDTVAIPYLDKRYGHMCAYCANTGNLDVDHILNRGSHPQLKMNLKNVQFLCRRCHYLKTDGFSVEHV